jgi:hypothetical protein
MAQDRTPHGRGDAGEQEPLLDPAEEELYAGTKIDSEEEVLAAEEAVEDALAVGGTVLPQDTEVQGMAYMMGRWRVRPEQKADFIAAWHELGTRFRTLPHPPADKGVLVQSVDEPDLFYSFSPRLSLTDIQTMHQDAAVQAALATLRDYCSEVTTGTYRVVATEG